MKKEKFTAIEGEEIYLIHEHKDTTLKNKFIGASILLVSCITVPIIMVFIVNLELFEESAIFFWSIFMEVLLIIPLLAIVFGYNKHKYFITSKRISEKYGRKTKEIFIKNIGNVIIWGSVQIIEKNDKGESYIKMAELIDVDNEEIGGHIVLRS